MIYIVDFGSQTAHLISRRIKELGSDVKIVHPEEILRQVQDDKNTRGIILSGGPSSVYQKGAPAIDPKVFSLNIPVLTICYGLQLMAKLLGGKVISGRKEYGPATLQFKVQPFGFAQGESSNPIQSDSKFKVAVNLPSKFTVWMSHGDEVISLPKGFEIIGSTEHVKNAFVGNLDQKIYGVQFHPEVEHTEFGSQILKNFIGICDLENNFEVKNNLKSQISNLKNTTQSSKLNDINVQDIKENIKKTVGEVYVIGAVSGGVDSTVAGVLTAEAIGEKFIPVYVENGLMREGTEKHVLKIFKNHHIKPIVVDAVGETLQKLKGVSSPEKKRKIIGNFYVKIFEKEMRKLIKSGKNVKFLLQGTIYSDVIESGAPRHPDEQKDMGTKHSSKIKSHHNVGGLPQNMKLKLLEPLRNFYKDEVRRIGKSLGLPDEFIYKQPFPGPGYAVRIRGEVTKKRLEQQRLADNIVMEELKQVNILKDVFISFPVMTGAYSTAVKGDGRFFGEVVALRVVQSKDIMTAKWVSLPYEVLQKISSRIVNEIPGISRVVYDITTKPPATMEWE